MNFDLAKIPHLDILEEIDKALGHRIKLDDVAQATLGSGKSGDGLKAVQYWRTGRMEELKKYCLDDVKITKQIYEYALKNGKLLYRDFFTIKEIPLQFVEPQPRVGARQQSVLF
jgi:DEAD/DEAH box helicase domain-containing protein